MASSSHYHYHKDDDDDFDNIFDDFLENPDLFPEPKERKKHFRAVVSPSRTYSSTVSPTPPYAN